MKGLKPFLSLAVGLLACAIIVGCAGSIPQNGPAALNISHAPLKDGVIGVGYQQLLVGTGGVQPYTWTISAGQLPPGLTLSTDGVISGTPTQTGQFNFTAQVVDSQSPTQAINTWATNITVNDVLSLASQTLATGLVGGNYSATVTAMNGLAPYRYTVIFGSLPEGLTLAGDMNDNSATISGTPTTAGVYTFTIQATDGYSEVATGQFTITVVGRLSGPYVLMFNGFNNGQPFYDVAQLVASGDMNGSGTLTGFLDQVGPGGTAASNLPVTGSYTIAQNSNFGTLTITRSDDHTSLNFNVVVSSSSDSKVIMSDSNAPNAYGSGLLKKQTLQVLAGGANSYAFGLFGNDAAGARYAGAGMFAVGASSSNAQPVNGGEEDLNDNGTISSQVFITGGSLGQADGGSGRGTLSLTTASGTANYVYYVVSTTEMVAVDTDASGPATLVDILQQQLAGASGSFTNDSLKGQSVIQLNGVATNNGSPVPSAAVGVVTFDGAGNIARTDSLAPYYTDEDDGGVVSAVSYASGTYNVDTTCGSIQSACGRVTVNLTGAPTQPVWYLTGSNQAFVVDTNASVTSGLLQSQTVPSTGFNLSNLLGSYLGGTVSPVLSSITNELDVAVTPPPGGIWNVTYDTSGPGGPANAVQFTGNYDCGGTAPNCSDMGTAFGRFEVTGPGSASTKVSILYIIGSGSTGITGGKGGIIGINVGKQSDGTADPNPRLTFYGR